MQLAPAQLYIHFNTGYSFSTQPYIHQNRVITDSIIDMFPVKFAYGKGLNLGMGLGYSISDNISVELVVTTALLTASSSNNNWEQYFLKEYIKLHLSGLNGDAKMKNASIQIAPLFVYSAILGKFGPYLKAGLNLLYVKSSYTNNYTYRYLNDSFEWYLEYTELKREYKGNLTLGFRGSLGTYYRLSDRMMLSAEFVAVNSVYHFTESRTLIFKVDGVEKVGELEENPVRLAHDEGRIDYSHIGVNIGIKYYLR
jgi:outer membrane protein W